MKLPKGMTAHLLVGITEDYLADVGRVVVLWSQIEQHFDLLFLTVAVMEGRSSGKLTQDKTKRMARPFARRVKEMRAAIKNLELAEDQSKKWHDVLSELSDLRSRRDVLSHGVFSQKFTSDGAAPPKLVIGSAVVLYKSWAKQKAHTFTTITHRNLKDIIQREEALLFHLMSLALDSRSRGRS